MDQLRVETTALDGVRIIHPPTNFEDFRGGYVELYNRDLFHAAGLAQDFVQDDFSWSERHVLRGLHGDGKTWKLVSCLYGRFYLVVVNHDRGSPQFLRWQGFTLSDANRLMVLIPPMFGNGHVVLSERAIFHYKQTTNYDRPSQFTLRWDDPKLGIFWPVTNPVLSQRDAEAAFL
jgi:dTDP-4-dehydrorhamnose 3,5-epimerase